MAEQLQPHPTLADVRERTLAELLEAHGPIVDYDAAAQMLSFNSRATFLRAVKQGRVSLALVRPPARRKTFVAAPPLAAYISDLVEVPM